MDKIILGLLILKPRTIYGLIKRIKEGLDLMYSCSTGSVQAALKKLLKGGYIYSESVAEGGRIKKIYSVTPAGREYFDRWVNAGFETRTHKSPELAKVYFMGLASDAAAVKNIEGYVSELEEIYKKLESVCSQGYKLLGNRPENRLPYFQLKSAEYGRDFMRFNIDWYKKFLKELEGEKYAGK